MISQKKKKSYLIYVLDEDDIARFIFVQQLVIWFYSKVTNFISLIINKVKNCQNLKKEKKKKRNKGKSKKEKENEKLKGRQNNSCYSCHRNCKNHLEFESHL